MVNLVSGSTYQSQYHWPVHSWFQLESATEHYKALVIITLSDYQDTASSQEIQNSVGVL